MTPSLSDLRRKAASRLGPFFLYLALAISLNAYPIAAAIRAANEYNGDVGVCRRAMSWLYTNTTLCVLHIIMAIYIAIVGKTLVKRWDEEVAATAAAQSAGGKVAASSVAAADAGAPAVSQQQASSSYVAIEGPTGSATEEDLADVADTAASAPTTVDVLQNLASRCTLRLYLILIVYFLCWTTVGLKRHMMNAGYCGGNIRGHVADSVLCAVIFLILGQGVLCFGAWRAAKIMGQGRVSGLSRPAYGVEA